MSAPERVRIAVSGRCVGCGRHLPAGSDVWLDRALRPTGACCGETAPVTPPGPAEELRQAAAVLRERAEAARKASPDPWAVTDEHVVRCADGMIVADRSGTDHPAERADLPYIAAVRPGVGLALADWLEATVRAVDGARVAIPDAAVAVARQILGGEA